VNRDGTVSKVGIVEAMIIWLESLFLIIHEPDEKEIRNHAMGLYNILVFLATYIACIQKEDQNRRVDTIELFQLIEQQIASIDQDYIKSFDNQQLMQLMRLRQIVDDEIFVIEITGQSTSKKTYLEILQSIRKMLDELFDF
ncbi:MAG: hypothetical protein ACXWV9_10740, partial [Flavisolibacter sp.]